MNTFKMFFLFCFLFTALYADEIHLKDSSILNGKVIQITGNTIEFDPEGDKPFERYSMSEVTKIVYDDGTVFIISDDTKKDVLHMEDGSIIKCTIKEMNADTVLYTSEGSEVSSLPRKQIVKIVFGDDEKRQLYENEIPSPEIPSTSYRENDGAIRDTGFINSFIRIGFIAGDLEITDGLEEEMDINRSYFINACDDTSLTNSYLGFEVDLFPKSFKFQRRRGLDFTGIKLGIKSRYTNNKIEEEYEHYDYDNYVTTSYHGVMLDYDNVELGPEIGLLLSPRNDIFDFYFNMYLLCGYIFNGEINAAPAFRKARENEGIYYDRSQYHSGTEGYSILYGLGANFVFNRPLPVTLGFNISFNYTKLNFDKELPFYGNANGTSFSSAGLGISIGVHI